jgi:H+/Cl- antiporter ClcA
MKKTGSLLVKNTGVSSSSDPSSSNSGVDRFSAGAAAGVCAFPEFVRVLFEGGGWSSSVRSGESASVVERRRRLLVVEGPGVDATTSERVARELVAVVAVVIVVVVAFTLVAGVSGSVAAAVVVVGAAAAAAVSLALPLPVAALEVLEGAGAVLRGARVRVLRVSTVTTSWTSTSAVAGAGVRRVARRVDIALQ